MVGAETAPGVWVVATLTRHGILFVRRGAPADPDPPALEYLSAEPVGVFWKPGGPGS